MSNYIDSLYEFVASEEFLNFDYVGSHRNLEFQQKEEQLKAKLIVDNADWEKVIIPFINKGEITDNDVKEALIKFLVYYQQEFGYELEIAIDYFINT